MDLDEVRDGLVGSLVADDIVPSVVFGVRSPTVVIDGRATEKPPVVFRDNLAVSLSLLDCLKTWLQNQPRLCLSNGCVEDN